MACPFCHMPDGEHDAPCPYEWHNALVEKFAIRAALGNNGGEWATHYTEEQKEHWRQWVRDLAKAIKESMQ